MQAYKCRSSGSIPDQVNPNLHFLTRAPGNFFACWILRNPELYHSIGHILFIDRSEIQVKKNKKNNCNTTNTSIQDINTRWFHTTIAILSKRLEITSADKDV